MKPLETTPEYKVLTSLIRHHTLNALKAWNTVLLRMNFIMAEIQLASEINAFWRSSYLIRPAVLLKLSSLMSQAIDIVDNPAYLTLQRYFHQNAKYLAGKPIVARKVAFVHVYHLRHKAVISVLTFFFSFRFSIRTITKCIPLYLSACQPSS